MAKATYTEIATLAGVGTATVERVLNGRGGVSQGTAEKVILAARKLDWSGRLPERHRGITRIEVILVRPETSFYARLAQAFRRISASLDPAIQIHVSFMDEANPRDIAERIARPPAPRSGLIISSPDHPSVNQALADAVQRGTPVVQVVTHGMTSMDFVGIDNLAVGRMAGMLMARMGAVKGTIVALCHGPIYSVHRDRVRGFTEAMARHGSADVQFAHVYFGADSRKAGAACVRDALGRWPDLAGFYNAGGGNGSVLEALRRADRKVFFVGHELNETTTAALEDGTADVIFDQLPETQARRAVDILLSRLGLIDMKIDNPPIRFTTITAENL